MVKSVIKNAWLVIPYMLALFDTYRECRKSDYKRLVFSEFVENEIKRMFYEQLEGINKGVEEGSETIKELFEKYSDEQKDFFLHRLQPGDAVGSKYNISIGGNRKKSLTIETIAKRRPLILQIDDFLFEDECDYLVQKAEEEGMEDSKTGGAFLEEIGFVANAYDEFGLIPFEDVDTDGDFYINNTELQKLFSISFDNKMGMVLISDIMKKTCLDFDLDGKIAPWEWNSKNITKLVMILNETQVQNPASKVRYSDQSWLDHSNTDDPVLASIQDRIHKLTGMPLPLLQNSEKLQVVRYVPGGHYDCHLDSDPRYYPDDFGPCCHLIRNTNEEDVMEDCSTCRFMTILYYLEDPDLGGETAFPIVGLDPNQHDLADDNFSSGEDWCDLSIYCQKSKVIVKPKKGRAILWYNHFIHPDTNWTGPVDRNSLHGGCAVHKGSKWIANNWINAGFDKLHDILSWARSEVARRLDKEEDERIKEKEKEERIKEKEKEDESSMSSP